MSVKSAQTPEHCADIHDTSDQGFSLGSYDTALSLSFQSDTFKVAMMRCGGLVRNE